MSLRVRHYVEEEREAGEEIRGGGGPRAAARGRLETIETQAPARPATPQRSGDSESADAGTREDGRAGWLDGLSLDLRYGFRMLWKSPAYTFISVLTLALGIGASTAIFSVVYGILLRPLPYHKPEQIVRVMEVNAKGQQMQFADPNFEDLRAESRLLQGMAQMRSSEAPVSSGGDPERVNLAVVSKDFFSVMAVKPVAGRLFSPEEQQFGAAPAALVSYSYWQRHFRGASDLGALKLTVSNRPATVVGVLPPGFNFPDGSQVWMAREAGVRLPSRSAHNWQVVARLRDGASLEQARAELSGIARRLSREYSAEKIHMVDAAVLPLKDALTADVKPALLVLQGAAGLLLLVACANVMNLSLAQASARAGELAVRVALGATRWRLVRQFLAEALFPCLLGGSLGVLAAYFGVGALVALAPHNIPRLDEVSVNLPLLGFALALSLVVAAGLGVLTALRSTSGEVQSALSEGGRRQGAGVRSQRAGRIIVAGQIAITLTLLVGAGLLGRSMLRVLSVDPGFETEHVATMDLKLPDLDTQTEGRRAQFLEQLITRLRALPGVRAVGGVNALPLKSGQYANGTFAVVNPQQLSPAQRELIERSATVSPKNPDPAFVKDLTAFMEELFRDPARTGQADYVVASEGYFQALGIPLRGGRLFDDGDGPDAPHVAVISESVARQKWPGQDPVGHTIEFGNMDGDLRLLRIIGVVGEVRARGLEAAPRPTVYVSYRQRPRSASQFNVVLRTDADPAAVLAPARGVLNQLDPTIAPRLSTFTQIYSESLNSRRFTLLLVGVFALTALLLAMAGVFGVLSYSVARRTREIGVRIALGATAGNILRMVLGQGLVTAAVGTAVGLGGAFALTRTMRSLLFEVSPNDPLTIAGVALLLILVALLASYIPARRATRVDPMVALRYE